jgi:glucose/arabinose dehydrogenase
LRHVALVPLLALALLPAPAVPEARAQATLPAGLADSLVIGGLALPAAMAQLADGRVLVLEQKSARLRVIVRGALAAADPAGTIDHVRTTGGEQGALGIAVDPGWPARPYVYVHCDDDAGPVIRISRYTLAGDLAGTSSGSLTLDVSTRHDLVADLPDAAPNHNGGTLRFGTDGMLYDSMGEDADACGAQDAVSLKGSILRLDVSRLPPGPGAAPRALVAPAGNPWADSPDSNRRLLWAKGLRNPFRFSIDPATGFLYIADVGQDTWEEIDQAPVGGLNFGWPIYEGDAFYTTCPATLPLAVAPIATYDHSQGSAVVGGPLYRAPAGATSALPVEYDGRLFYSDYYSGSLWLLRDSGTGWVQVAGVESGRWATGLDQVSDWMVGHDGGLWYCRQAAGAGGATGQIRRIVPLYAPVTVPATGVDLAPPFPVPAPGAVTLRVRVSSATSVDLRVYDVRGSLVSTLRSGTVMAAPGEDVVWDGRDDHGDAAPSGLYVVRLRAAGESRARRVVLVR